MIDVINALLMWSKFGFMLSWVKSWPYLANFVRVKKICQNVNFTQFYLNQMEICFYSDMFSA